MITRITINTIWYYTMNTITNNGQDFYHDTGWQKLNITVCFQYLSGQTEEIFCIKWKFCNNSDALYCTAAFMFNNDKNRIYVI